MQWSTLIYSQQNADCNGAVRYIFAETAILVVTDCKNHSNDVWGFVSRRLVPSQDDGHGDAVEGLKCFLQKRRPF